MYPDLNRLEDFFEGFKFQHPKYVEVLMHSTREVEHTIGKVCRLKSMKEDAL